MQRSIINKQVLPFVGLLAGLLLGALLVDWVLHQLDLVWIGRWLGIPGSLLILSSFLYSLRKRKKITFGKPKQLLALHETLTWIGALMILVHAGIHVFAILPWLALIAMLVNVASGLTGKYLLDRSRRDLAEKQTYYRSQGMSDEAIERQLFWDATTVDVMKQWRVVHLPITLAFGVLALAHILSIFFFWQWQ
ncbi:MAG: hypothetical protein P8045_09580 [Candidatus Thiodiazotropha sp.]|jgi:hypothetical protein